MSLDVSKREELEEIVKKKLEYSQWINRLLSNAIYKSMELKKSYINKKT
jgi:hypothetical protein